MDEDVQVLVDLKQSLITSSHDIDQYHLALPLQLRFSEMRFQDLVHATDDPSIQLDHLGHLQILSLLVEFLQQSERLLIELLLDHLTRLAVDVIIRTRQKHLHLQLLTVIRCMLLRSSQWVC